MLIARRNFTTVNMYVVEFVVQTQDVVVCCTTVTNSVMVSRERDLPPN